MMDDIKIWKEHFVLGVGPGIGKWLRDKTGTAAHTEYSRLLSEHGLCGIGAMVILFLMLARQARQSAPGGHRALVVSLIAWALLFMTSDDMRLVAAPLALCFGRIKPSSLRSDGNRGPAPEGISGARNWFIGLRRSSLVSARFASLV
jgi:hypothetical protein